MPSAVQKTSWADDVDELEQPKTEDFVDENGVRTTIEYTVNEDGKKVKITRRIKRTLQKSLVEHAVAERKTWAKFGHEKGSKPGPDRATTTVGENVALKLSAGNKSSEPEPSAEQTMKDKLAKSGAGKVVCRLCKGDHFTAKCPYKDTLAGLDSTEAPPTGNDDDGESPALAGVAPVAPSTGGPSKYVPPSMRNRGPGESMSRPGGSRDDLPTLRVTNISEDTQENDLRDLFGMFGRVARVYVGRDRETGIGKGFAFVSFEDKTTAQKAMEKTHGRGYDSLILNVQWSHDAVWSFNLRTCGYHSPSSSSASPSSSPQCLSADAQLLKDIDLTSRNDEAEYKPNPWSIAKINAALRPKSSEQSSTEGAQTENAKEKNLPKPKGMIADLLNKQAEGSSGKKPTGFRPGFPLRLSRRPDPKSRLGKPVATKRSTHTVSDPAGPLPTITTPSLDVHADIISKIDAYGTLVPPNLNLLNQAVAPASLDLGSAALDVPCGPSHALNTHRLAQNTDLDLENAHILTDYVYDIPKPTSHINSGNAFFSSPPRPSRFAQGSASWLSSSANFDVLTNFPALTDRASDSNLHDSPVDLALLPNHGRASPPVLKSFSSPPASLHVFSHGVSRANPAYIHHHPSQSTSEFRSKSLKPVSDPDLAQFRELQESGLEAASSIFSSSGLIRLEGPSFSSPDDHFLQDNKHSYGSSAYAQLSRRAAVSPLKRDTVSEDANRNGEITYLASPPRQSSVSLPASSPISSPFRSHPRPPHRPSFNPLKRPHRSPSPSPPRPSYRFSAGTTGEISNTDAYTHTSFLPTPDEAWSTLPPKRPPKTLSSKSKSKNMGGIKTSGKFKMPLKFADASGNRSGSQLSRKGIGDAEKRGDACASGRRKITLYRPPPRTFTDIAPLPSPPPSDPPVQQTEAEREKEQVLRFDVEGLNARYRDVRKMAREVCSALFLV
ncbi:hypothetical protein EW146_g7112 [Bondarzewia mesenterica]|uniref:Eukaryotic translation initiation factor 3 subunit G n=1 Tax=Bondarzewia mesenterica TaxID=1095465 RepID=A0A4S4LLP3_9AGAM|nr:hypothetical protein EW146_g7112 [Bondarzewia mesenterica]